MRHPGCQVVGVDLERPIVDAANAHYGLPNLRFMQWDYFRFGKPEDLEPVDTLLCAMGVVHHMPHNETLYDPLEVRRSREYKIQRDHAIGYFDMWRMAAKEGALLFAVLRVRLFARFVAWLDAAREAGWAPDLERTWHVDIPDGSDSYALPGFAFRAVPRAMSPSDAKAQLLPEAALADHWAWFDRRSASIPSAPTPSDRLEGGAALTAYRGLADKAVLGVWEGRLAGNKLTRDEVGTAGTVAYAFRHDAGGEFLFAWIPVPDVKQLAAALAAKKPLRIFDESRPSETPASGNPFAGGKSPFAGGKSPFAG